MIDPVVYFFALGAFAGLVRADLRLPPAIYDFVSTVLLISIGLKGGVELARQSSDGLVLDLVAVIALGIVLTFFAFAILRWIGRFERADAAATAAHYGSVSVATFAVAAAYLAARDIAYEPRLALFLVVLEVPGILAGIVIARGFSQQTQWSSVLHDAFFGRGVLLLLGGMLIGWAAGPEGLAPMKPLFFDLFKGVLALFLLEMGLIAAHHLDAVRRRGFFIIAFAIIVPLLFAFLGAGFAQLLELSLGGTILLATLAASASYIAAPAAMRTAVPDANPGLSLAAALGVTFPFNIVLGIPLYERLSHWLHS